MKVPHLNLKCENVLVKYEGTNGIILQLTDYGIVEAFENTICVTSVYSAPEILDSKHKYDPFAADVFSLGIILYEFILHKIERSKKDINSGKCPKIPKDAKTNHHVLHEMAKRCTKIDPKARPTIKQLTEFKLTKLPTKKESGECVLQ